VAKAMDCYYLGRKACYHEAFDSVLDEVLGRLPGPEIHRALPLPDLGEVPLDLDGYVKDPVMHLVHQAIRQAKLGQEHLAEHLAEHLLETAFARLRSPADGPPQSSTGSLLRCWAREPKVAVPWLAHLEKVRDGLGGLPDWSALKRSYLPMVDDCLLAITHAMRIGIIDRDVTGDILSP